MALRDNDVRPGEQTSTIPNSFIELFPRSEQAATEGPSPPDSCASCGDTEAIQWLKMITDWEEVVCNDLGIETPNGVCLIPLCNRCRAWAEIIEIAEMAAPKLPDCEKDRILYERDRFLTTLDVNLIRGIRVSAELTSFSE